uniref:Reverse transcriptase domain-containing protein n=1 Tax=Cyprinus carpio carpio TaxID=630221 RepID=A0A9J8BJ19_CYPCA
MDSEINMVKVGDAVYDEFIVENGIPQGSGSVISPLLFIIMINDVFSRIDRKYNLKKMQYALNEVEKWSGENGFKFSVEKTKVIVFTKMRRNMDVKLKLYKKELERVRTVRFLGVWFDNRLNWRAEEPAEAVKYTYPPFCLNSVRNLLKR